MGRVTTGDELEKVLKERGDLSGASPNLPRGAACAIRVLSHST